MQSDGRVTGLLQKYTPSIDLTVKEGLSVPDSQCLSNLAVRTILVPAEDSY